MKLGIISDTHNKLDFTKEAVEKFLSYDISYLLHAGDIGQKVLEYLDTFDIPTIAVFGNTDTNLTISHLSKVRLHTQPYYFKIQNTTFKLMHQPYFLTPDSDIIIYGHLHKFECKRATSLYINPGEVCARNKPRIECALLDTETMEVWYVYKEQEWHIQKVCG